MSRPLRVLFIVSIGAVDDDLRAAIGTGLVESACVAQVRVVETADAARAVAAASSGFDRVVAVGGDGTLGSVATGLCDLPADERPSFGIIAGGTANDFAVSVGIGELSTVDAVRLALSGTPSPTDVGRTNNRCFLNMLTTGFPASLSDETPRPLKDALGGLAYPLHGLANLGAWTPTPVVVSTDEGEWRGDALAVFIANGNQVGGGICVAPDASPHDGAFDVVIAPRMDAAEIVGAAVSHFFDRTTRPASVKTLRAKWVEIAAEQDLAVSADGEVERTASLRAEILPGALQLVLPS